MALTAREIQDAYVTFFNRAADKEGFTYWTSYPGSISDLYATFAQQTEYTSVYGGKTTEVQITLVYQNLFNRAPDAEGLAYWSPLVEAGTITLANLALTVNRGAQGTDTTALSGKIDAAIVETNATDAVDAAATVTYDAALATYTTAVSTAATALTAATTANATYDTAAAAVTNVATASAASLLAATSATAAAAAVTAATAQATAATALQTAAAATLSTADNTVASSAVTASTTAATAAATAVTAAAIDTAAAAAAATSQTFTLTASAPSAAEGNSGTNTLTYVLSLDKAPTSAVTINYQTLNTGTATAGTDYTTAAGIVTFAVGQTVATVAVTVAGDTTFEADETVITTFSGSELAATVTATGTITNDDVDTANVAQTFTLTTGVDTAASFTGGTADDTFNGVIVNTGAANTTGTTFSAGDAIVGGAGTDSLTISVTGTAAGTNAGTSITGIERVMVSNVSGQTQSIDMGLVSSDLTTVGHTSSNNNAVTTFASLNKIVAAELSNGNAGITLGYNAAVVASTADVASLTLSNQTGGAFTTTGIETLNVASNTSANTVTLAAGPTTVNVSGDARLTLGALDTGVTTLNASTNTGGLVATMSATATAAVTGSTAADTITTGTTLSGVGAVNAGDGIDTLVTTADAVIAAAADGARYTNFETLSIANTTPTATANRAQDVSLISGITTLNVTQARAHAGGNADTTQNVTFTNLAAATNTISITGLANADTDTADDLSVTVNATRLLNTTADAITVNLGTSTAVSGANALAGTGVAGQVILDVSLANEESITINSLGGTTGANLIDDLTNTAATSLTLTGARALTIDSMTSAVVTSINASAMTGAFIMNTANGGAVASTITGGTGADTLLGGSAADNISGGAGNDSITGAGGADVITGGDGLDTIVGGAGIDNLSGGGGNDTFNVTTTTHFINLASAEVVSGGAGNDNLSFVENTGITVAAADLLGINSVETITINGTANAGSVTLTDAVYTANGATTLNIVDGALTQGILTVNASALTAANSVVTTGNTSTGVNDSLVGGAGADSFLFSTTTGLEAGDTVAGGAGTDTITLSAVAAAVTGVLTATTGVERVVTTGTAGNVIITVGADATIAAAGTLTVDASSVTNGAFDLAYDGSAVTTATKVQNVTGTVGADTIAGGSGNDIIVGGEGADSITGGGGIDNLSGGAGNDIFAVATLGAGFVGLTTAETVSGGEGNDTLQFTAGAVVIAASDLVSVSGIETIQIGNTSETASLTLTDAFYTTNGATTLAVNSSTATSGVLTLAASTLSAANSVQLNLAGAANTAVHNVVLGAGNDTVTIDMDALNNTAITIQGGAGTDTMVFTENTADATVTVSAAVTGFENVSFITGLGGAFAATVNDANVAAGVTQTINGSNITGTLLWNGAAELDGKFSITGGTGIDTLTGGSLVDTISGGAGADVITGGLGADALAGGIGADTFVYATVAQSNGTNTDSISDFTTGTDKLQVTLNYSTLTTALDINAVRSSAGVAGTSLAQDTLSGQRGQYVYDTSSNSLFVNVNADNLLTTTDYKIGINAASTATASVVEGDINFVITGGTNADVIIAGGGADTIDGGTGADNITGGAGDDQITGGNGADTITGGTGADSIILGAEGATVDTLNYAAGDSTATVTFTAATARATFAGNDTVTGFQLAGVDKLNLAGTGIVATSTGIDGTDSTAALTAGAPGTDVIKSHAIGNGTTAGIVTFDDADIFGGAVALGDAGDVAAAIQYLSLQDIGAAGDTLMFVGNSNSYVYQQTAATAGGVGGFTVVELVGVSGLLLMTTGTTAGGVLIS